MNRLEPLNDLVTFSKPLAVLTSGLSKLDWDYDGPPLVINALQIQDVLQRFLASEFNAKELEGWANLIECREDLDFEKSNCEALENTIYCLANPSLQGEITPALCKELINTLN